MTATQAEGGIPVDCTYMLVLAGLLRLAAWYEHFRGMEGSVARHVGGSGSDAAKCERHGAWVPESRCFVHSVY